MRAMLYSMLLNVGVLCGAAYADDASKTFLFIEKAGTAEMDANVLELTGIDDKVQVFADRPYRDSGTASLQAFMDAWAEGSDNFENDPPNAALIGSANGETVTLIVELGQPQLSDGGISYPFKLIDGVVSPTLEDAVIVIDGIDWSHFACCVGN